LPKFGDVEPLPHDKRVKTRSAETMMGQIRGVGFDIRFNRRSRKEEWRQYPAGEVWKPFDDRSRGVVFSRIADTYRRRSGDKSVPYVWRGQEKTDHWNRLMASLSIDPFALWLSELDAWDKRQRLDTLLYDSFVVDEGSDPEAVAWLGAAPLIAAVARAIRPGAKFDHLPTIVGPQGIGKSTYWRFLLPPQYRNDWFTSSFHLRMDRGRKDQVEALKGVVFGEAADFGGVTRSDLAQLKTFITDQTDTVRLAYRRDEEVLPRRFVLVGTADKAGVLPDDEAGMRRFPVVEVTGGAPARMRAGLDDDREMLWAKALHRARPDTRGELEMSPRLTDVCAAVANRHRNRNPLLDDAIDDAIQAALDAGVPIILANIRIGDRGLGAGEVQNAAARSRDQGGTRGHSKIGGRHRRCWKPPQTGLGLQEGPPSEQFHLPDEPPL